MEVFRGRSAHEIYRGQLQFLLERGSEVTVRGLRSRELLDAVTIITEPRRRVHLVPGRRANPFLALSESLWLLAGRNDVQALLPYNQRILDYSDDGETLYDAYGYRIKDQIPELLYRLAADRADRRAVLTVWEPRDLTAETKSPPCNDLIMFKLRDGRLHMTVFCRSNDIHWGLYAVNLCQFSILQEYLAVRLRAEVGIQTHISNSLHVYLDGPGAKPTERMERLWGAYLPALPEPQPLFPYGLPMHEIFVHSCNRVLDSAEIRDDVPFLEFASDFLRYYRQRDRSTIRPFKTCLRHADRYADWVMAGKAFLEEMVHARSS